MESAYQNPIMNPIPASPQTEHKLTPEEYRESVVREILSTETTYVKTLQTLIDVNILKFKNYF
jgi:hypothetical protein